MFSAEAVDVEESPPATTMIEGTMAFIMGEDTATVFLRVSEVWKGPRRQTVMVNAAASPGSGCGYPFEEGREYLVYATGEDPSVSLCSETKPLSVADADLGALGDGEAPEDAGARSDTSGGVSVGAMVALAGLAVTGSFLLAVRLLRAG